MTTTRKRRAGTPEDTSLKGERWPNGFRRKCYAVGKDIRQLQEFLDSDPAAYLANVDKITGPAHADLALALRRLKEIDSAIGFSLKVRP